MSPRSKRRPTGGPPPGVRRTELRGRLVEACIAGAHAHQLLLAARAGGLASGPFGMPAGFDDSRLNELVRLHESLVSLDAGDVRAWLDGRGGRAPAAERLAGELLSAGLPLAESLPVSVATRELSALAPGSSREEIRAVAHLLQLVLEIERDGTLLQDAFRLFAPLGLAPAPSDLGLPDDDAAFGELGGRLAAATAPAPFATDMAAWRIALRKIQNWSLKHRSLVGAHTMAKEVLADPGMRGAAEAARSMKPMRVLVIGHSYTMTIHFSTPASFTITAAEVLRSLGAPVEWKQLGEGGLSAERARERWLAEGLAAKPDFTLIVTVLKTDADYEALRAMAAALRARGSRVAVLDRVHPDAPFWANADSAKLRAVAGATGIEILEVGALVDSDPARGEFISLDGIHTTGPHHRLLARELVRFLLGMRRAALGGGR